MKENKIVLSARLMLAVVLIFGLGTMLGKVMSVDRLAKIEGYKVIVEQDSLIAADTATPDNATSSDACPEEEYATDPNATSSNAEPEIEEPVITDPIKVELDGKEKIELKNEDITEAHIKYIRESTKEIILDATNDTKIKRELLSAISAVLKNTLVVNSGDNQFVFYGSEIETITNADVYVKLEKLSSKADVSSRFETEKGIVIDFLDGNKFPEGTIVRIKATTNVSEEVTTDAQLYSFDAVTSEIKLVQTNIGKEEGYYNLKISGDKDYILVNKDVKLATGTTTNNNSNKEVVEFVDTNMTYLFVIAVSMAVIIVVSIILIMNRNKKEIVIKSNVETPVETPEVNVIKENQ